MCQYNNDRHCEVVEVANVPRKEEEDAVSTMEIK